MLAPINNANGYVHKRLLKHGFQFLKHPVEDAFVYVMKTENTPEYTNITKFKIPEKILNILRPISISDFLHFKIKDLHIDKINKSKHFVSTSNQTTLILSKSKNQKRFQLVTPKHSYNKTVDNNLVEELLQTSDGNIYHQLPYNGQKTKFHITKPHDKTILSNEEFEAVKEKALSEI